MPQTSQTTRPTPLSAADAPPAFKASILARVKKRMDLLDIKPARASTEAGLGPDLVRDWFRKPKAIPTISSLAALAPVLKTHPEWLAFGTGPENQGESSPQAMAIPLLSWVAASAFVDMGECPADAAHIHQVGLPDHRLMALTVRGDSMNLIASDGSTIIVDLDDTELVPRRLYVFRDGAGATFKRYMIGPTRLEPMSTNPAHEPIAPTATTRTLGRVIRVISDL